MAVPRLPLLDKMPTPLDKPHCKPLYAPGFRQPENRFSPGVLLYNWAEECRKYQHPTFQHQSTYNTDYLKFCSYEPNVDVRRKGKLRMEDGNMPKELFFGHHWDTYKNNMISWYDEHYNRRERPPEQAWPEKRHREYSSRSTGDACSRAWVPERTDYPLQGVGTRWGLYKKLIEKFEEEKADASTNTFTSTYDWSYNQSIPPEGLVTTRYATPKERSLLTAKVDAINNDLPFARSNQPEIVFNIKKRPT